MASWHERHAVPPRRERAVQALLYAQVLYERACGWPWVRWWRWAATWLCALACTVAVLSGSPVVALAWLVGALAAWPPARGDA